MSMKLWNFKVLITIIALISATVPAASARECFTPTNSCPCNDSLRYEKPKYQQRVEKRRNAWLNIMPRLFTLQYAGDIGMFSAGFGWNYGRSKQWETHALIGFLPKRENYSHYWTLTLREIYNPWRIGINSRCDVTPLSVSMSLNSILHGDFWVSEPDRYPSGYYGFSSRMRFHIGLGQRFTYLIPENKRYLHSKISVYYEVSTCDLYVRQKILDKSVPLKDIIALGIGIIYTL